MVDAFSGPWLVLACVALVATLAFAAGLGVPRERPAGVRGRIVRWGHALVWLLLALTFLALSVGQGQLAGPLGLLALIGYIVFLWALAGSRRA